MSSTSWEGIFTTLRNLFHIFMFYILKSTYLYRSGDYFFKNNFFFVFLTRSEITISVKQYKYFFFTVIVISCHVKKTKNKTGGCLLAVRIDFSILTWSMDGNQILENWKKINFLRADLIIEKSIENRLKIDITIISLKVVLSKGKRVQEIYRFLFMCD